MSDAIPIGIPVADLRPTQMSVGLREVEHKRMRWRDADEETRSRLLRNHVLPAVIGPHKRTYIVDHHHFARALLEEDAGCVAVYILADLSALSKHEFWTFLDNSGWCHAYDEKGNRCALDAIPKRLSKLADDPFRSLVGDLIRHGGVAKTNRPFAEFLWADFLRHRIDHKLAAHDAEKALAKALVLAKSDKAKSLPGWCGANAAGL